MAQIPNDPDTIISMIVSNHKASHMSPRGSWPRDPIDIFQTECFEEPLYIPVPQQLAAIKPAIILLTHPASIAPNTPGAYSWYYLNTKEVPYEYRSLYELFHQDGELGNISSSKWRFCDYPGARNRLDLSLFKMRVIVLTLAYRHLLLASTTWVGSNRNDLSEEAILPKGLAAVQRLLVA